MKTTGEGDTDHSAEVRVRETDWPDSLSEDNRGGESDTDHSAEVRVRETDRLDSRSEDNRGG